MHAQPLPGYSPRKYHHVLFNEQSNWLEPYSHSSPQQWTVPALLKEMLLTISIVHKMVQVLQKGLGSDYPQSCWFSASSGVYPSPSNGFVGAH